MAKNQTLKFVPRTIKHSNECAICGGACRIPAAAVQFHPNEPEAFHAPYCGDCITGLLGAYVLAKRLTQKRRVRFL